MRILTLMVLLPLAAPLAQAKTCRQFTAEALQSQGVQDLQAYVITDKLRGEAPQGNYSVRVPDKKPVDLTIGVDDKGKDPKAKTWFLRFKRAPDRDSTFHFVVQGDQCMVQSFEFQGRGLLPASKCPDEPPIAPAKGYQPFREACGLIRDYKVARRRIQVPPEPPRAAEPPSASGR